MNRHRLAGALMILASVGLFGCADLSTREAPSVTPLRLNHIYVQHRLADGRNLDAIFAEELRRRGYDAASGPLTLMPDGEDAIVSYVDTWTFDFTTYLIELDVTVQDARSGVTIATGRYFHPSLTGTSTRQMIDKVLDQIFKPHIPPEKTVLVQPD